MVENYRHVVESLEMKDMNLKVKGLGHEERRVSLIVTVENFIYEEDDKIVMEED